MTQKMTKSYIHKFLANLNSQDLGVFTLSCLKTDPCRKLRLVMGWSYRVGIKWTRAIHVMAVRRT